MPDWYFLLPLLFFTGLLAGLIDSISGGGGLITLPVLLSVGLPPTTALGTNKAQSMFGSFTATYSYARHGVVDLKDARLGILFTAIGTVGGVWSVQQIDPLFLGKLIPPLLILVLLYVIFGVKFRQGANRQPRVTRSAFYIAAGLGLGFYDGFFGPGVGSFWTVAFVAGLGFNLVRATGYTKAMNFTSNIVSAVMFFLGGYVWIAEAAVMAVGQIAGARIGSGLVMKNGSRLIRPVLIAIVLVTTVKLFYDYYIR